MGGNREGGDLLALYQHWDFSQIFLPSRYCVGQQLSLPPGPDHATTGCCPGTEAMATLCLGPDLGKVHGEGSYRKHVFASLIYPSGPDCGPFRFGPQTEL